MKLRQVEKSPIRRYSSGQHAYSRGVTLLELVVTVTISALLMTIAVPSFQASINSNRATVKANEFVAALNLARTEAAKRGVSVRVSASDPSTEENPWGKGWRVWVDKDADGTFNSAKDLTLRDFSALTGGATFLADTGDTEVRYLASGLMAGASAKIFLLRPDHCSGNQGRNIALNAAGRPSVSVVSCG